MKTVTVNKEELLKVLNRNSELHFHEYDKATTERADRFVEFLAQYEGKDSYVIPERVHFPMPPNHMDDYERAIKMVEMEISDTIELNMDEFDQYVMNNWRWRHDFMKTAALYKK